jgi:hypothetical protein
MFSTAGESFHSTNQVQANGKSDACTSALQIQGLRHLLIERATGALGLENLALSFFEEAAEIILPPGL